MSKHPTTPEPDALGMTLGTGRTVTGQSIWQATCGACNMASGSRATLGTRTITLGVGETLPLQDSGSPKALSVRK